MDYLPVYEYFYNWDESVTSQTYDMTLITKALQGKEAHINTWKVLIPVLSKCGLFTKESLKLSVFLRFTALLSSRSFGSNLPSSIMIPMADNFNHGNKDCSWELINTELQLNADSNNSYFTPSRFSKDNSHIFKEN
jgi:hypothetical protein